MLELSADQRGRLCELVDVHGDAGDYWILVAALERLEKLEAGLRAAMDLSFDREFAVAAMTGRVDELERPAWLEFYSENPQAAIETLRTDYGAAL